MCHPSTRGHKFSILHKWKDSENSNKYLSKKLRKSKTSFLPRKPFEMHLRSHDCCRDDKKKPGSHTASESDCPCPMLFKRSLLPSVSCYSMCYPDNAKEIPPHFYGVVHSARLVLKIQRWIFWHVGLSAICKVLLYNPAVNFLQCHVMQLSILKSLRTQPEREHQKQNYFHLDDRVSNLETESPNLVGTYLKNLPKGRICS